MVNIRQIFVLVLALFSYVVGQSSDITQMIPMVPQSTSDTGTGIFSQSYNSPYQAVRFSAGLTNLVTRIPVGSTVSSWSFGQKSAIGDFPNWLTFIAPWSGSHEFALEFNATDAIKTGITPASFTFELRGSVFYTHGPTRFVEQEQRVVRLICHQHITTSLNQRSGYITPYFSQGGVTSGGQIPQSQRSAMNKVKQDEMGYSEQYNYNCPGNMNDSINGCSLESTAPGGVIWGNEGSMLVQSSGLQRIKSPLAMWGVIIVKAEAILVIDLDDTSKSVAQFGEDGVPLQINSGTVIVQKGVLRLVATTAAGSGTIRVAREGTLEVDPRTASGIQDVGTKDKPVQVSEGNVNLVSGEIELKGGLSIQGEGVLRVGMACQLSQTGATPHLIGGGTAGSSAVQEHAAIISGALIITTPTTFRGGARVQGLGYISMLAPVVIDIGYFGAKYPEAGISTSGPPTERPYPGILINSSLKLVQGGLRQGSGITLDSKATLDISIHGFQHFYDEGAVNELYGEITNAGSMVAFTPSTLIIGGQLKSTSMVRMVHPQSQFTILSKGVVNQSRQYGTRTGTTATTPTHLFALYVAGSTMLRDGAQLNLRTETSVDLSLEKPRYYSGSIFNSGALQVYDESVLETCSFEQQPDGAEVDHYYPRTSLQSSASGLAMVSDGKYTYNSDTGQIMESITAKQPLRSMRIKFGAIGGVDGSRYAGGINQERTGTWNPGTSFPSARAYTDGSASKAGDYALHGATQRAYSLTLEDATLRIDLVYVSGMQYYDQVQLESDVQIIRSRLHIVTNMQTNIHVLNTMSNGERRMSTMQAGGIAFKLPVMQAKKIQGQFSQITGINSRNAHLVKVEKGTKAPLGLPTKAMQTMASIGTDQYSSSITLVVEYNTDMTTVSITGYVTGRNYGWGANSAFTTQGNWTQIAFTQALAVLGYMYVQRGGQEDQQQQ